MKAYCINLDSRPERLRRMELLCSGIGLPFERVPAVDAQDPEVIATAASGRIRVDGRMISMAAYAIFQSHRKCWKALVDSCDSHAIILEDDVLLAEDIGQYLETTWIPPDADIVRLETYATRVHLDQGGGLPVGPRRLKRLRSRHAGTAGYVLSRHTADRLFALTNRVSTGVDEFLFSESSPVFANLLIYQMSPAPVIQGDRVPDIPKEETWISSTVGLNRYDAEDGSTNEPAPRVEHRATRLTRRLREELRSRRLGTEYVVVSHG